ncbi:helix-turn-helix domain-containing protein [Vibrio penaeicida]|uniref:helix-turn-helix domain-containing protein n=1 Tax=Vibrio penaeicida TaxID=104609 RepID=UPI000F848915|nr:helix-turn-helix domain-containing protein [Vibrio penaeicida]RTZ21867.1 helix-turn-helix domain-containing protein [Vibrio penaeicida]
MNLKALRNDRGWSQEQLSQMSGLSVRTIQRIEQGSKPGLESLKSLAAVFEVDIKTLQQETPMTNVETVTNEGINTEEVQVTRKVKRLKKFYSSLLSYVVTVGFLFIVNLVTSPEYMWAWWVAFGLGIGIVSQGVRAFELLNFFGDDWEKREIEKRMKK